MIFMTRPPDSLVTDVTVTSDNKIYEWRKERLIEAGWSDEWASHIAEMSHFKMDLHVAEAAIRCGSESMALDLLGITDFDDLTTNKK